MLRAYKYLIKPTPEQASLLNQYFGICRWVYNWALNKKIEDYKRQKEESVEKPKILSAFYEVARELPEIKKTEGFEWVKNAPALSLIYELQYLDRAYSNFFKRVKQGSGGGFPKFKSRYDRQSFTDKFQEIDFDTSKVKLPKLGWVEARLHRRFHGVGKSMTVSRDSTGKHYVSIIVEDGLTEPTPPEINNVLGIDKGTHNLLTLSNGETVANPKFFEKSQQRLAVLQRRLARKTKGSKAREKAKLLVAKQHERIANQRADYLHKTSKAIIDKPYDTVAVEGFNVRELMEGKKYGNKKIADVGWGQLTTQLEYKSKIKGKNFIKLDKNQKTNQTCLKCGQANPEVKYWTTKWECKHCNHLNIKGVDSAKVVAEFAKNQA